MPAVWRGACPFQPDEQEKRYRDREACVRVQAGSLKSRRRDAVFFLLVCSICRKSICSVSDSTNNGSRDCCMGGEPPHCLNAQQQWNLVTSTTMCARPKKP